MHPTTRLRILDYLRKKQTASVRDLSITFGMTGANVRHHLQVLETYFLIELVGQRQAERGRPENVYGLSRTILGDGLEALTGAMLSVWIRNIPKDEGKDGLSSIAQWLAGEKSGKTIGLLSLRLASLVERLNELHYQARWEAHAEGPHVILGHCPYAAIIADFPELCQMDASLLEHYAGLPVQQTAKLQPSAKGDRFCMFLVSTVPELPKVVG